MQQRPLSRKRLTTYLARPLAPGRARGGRTKSFGDVQKRVAAVIKSKIIVGHALKNDLQVRSAALPDSLRFRESPLRVYACHMRVRVCALECVSMCACVSVRPFSCVCVLWTRPRTLTASRITRIVHMGYNKEILC